LISQYASGVRHPKQDNIYILAKALNVDEGWLMGYGYSMEREPQPEENDIKRINSDECALLNDYRQLNDKGKEYIRQTMTIARNTYQKTSH